jgi:SNF2 family DNA or RNA helicase
VYTAACWSSSQTKIQKDEYEKARKQWGETGALHILVVNVEGLAFDRTMDELTKFCNKHSTMIVVDESTRIKHRQAQRTKGALKLRNLCRLARIASGTPIIKSPLNAFTQFKFLDPDILGYSNYKVFENHFALKGGYGGYQVLQYQNLDELTDKIDKASYRVLKDDCLDLDPKIYQKRNVPLNGEQISIYKQMVEDSIADIESMKQENKYLEATIILVKYLRLQQITSGFVPILDAAGQSQGYTPFGKGCPPKIGEALNIIDECQGKVIVWARFIPEIRMMCDALKKAEIPFVEFHGGINESDRVIARTQFQEDNDNIRVFVGQIQTGGVGITLNRARTVIYLSNTFNTEDRVQSEDRAHRIGTVGSVTYIDLIAPGTVDQHIMRSLREDKKLSDLILRDGIRAWI